MQIFDGLNVFELVDYSISNFNTTPVVEIYVNKNTNVNIEIENNNDQLRVVNKPKKQYLENGNHFRLHFKSVGDFDIYSKNSSEDFLNKLDFLYTTLKNNTNASVKIYIDLTGDCVEGEAAVMIFNVAFLATINQWSVLKPN